MTDHGVVQDRFGVPDVRSLSPDARAELRREVAIAVRDGMTRLEASRRSGVCRRTVGIWARTPDPVGTDLGREQPSAEPSSSPGVLTPTQEVTVLRTMCAASPCLLGLDGQLWTCRTVADLVEIQTGHRLGTGTIEHYLHHWHLTGAPLVRLDEDTPPPNTRTLWVSRHGVVAPGVHRTGRPPLPPAQILHALVAEAGRGAIHFRLSEEPFDLGAVRTFGRRLTQHLQRPIRLIVWRWPPDEAQMLEVWRGDPGPALTIPG